MYSGRLEGEAILMPYQSKPLNGDYYIANELINLKNKNNINRVIELGTCVGGSAKFFGENFDYVDTIEIVPEFQEIAKRRCEGINNIIFHLGSTVDILPHILKNCTDKTLIYTDSHWGSHFPLFDELSIIANSGLKPCIVVHDCLVPDEPNLGYDSYQGVDISYENMRKYLDAIYGEGNYQYYYNTDELSTEVKRGILYCTPKTTYQA